MDHPRRQRRRRPRRPRRPGAAPGAVLESGGERRRASEAADAAAFAGAGAGDMGEGGETFSWFPAMRFLRCFEFCFFVGLVVGRPFNPLKGRL